LGELDDRRRDAVRTELVEQEPAEEDPGHGAQCDRRERHEHRFAEDHPPDLTRRRTDAAEQRELALAVLGGQRERGRDHEHHRHRRDPAERACDRDQRGPVRLSVRVLGQTPVDPGADGDPAVETLDPVLHVVDIGAWGNQYADVGEAGGVTGQPGRLAVGEERMTGRSGGRATHRESVRFAADQEGDPAADLGTRHHHLTGTRCVTGRQPVRRQRGRRPVVAFGHRTADRWKREITDRGRNALYRTDLGDEVDRYADALGQRGRVLGPRPQMRLIAGDNE
jgi:hypothetical protein